MLVVVAILAGLSPTVHVWDAAEPVNTSYGLGKTKVNTRVGAGTVSITGAHDTSSYDLGTSMGPAPACHMEQNIDFNGYDIDNFPTPTAAACCAACSNRPWSYRTGNTDIGTDISELPKTSNNSRAISGCAFWSWNGPLSSSGNLNCFLKTSNTGRAPTKGVVSGKSTVQPAPAPALAVPANMPWKNTSLPVPERIQSLIKAMTLAEKVGQLQASAPAISRLDIPAYNWWSEAAHGVAWAGKATVFPCSLALGVTFDAPLLEKIGYIIGMEGRAKYNDALNATGGTSTPQLYGLTFFAPNVRISVLTRAQCVCWNTCTPPLCDDTPVRSTRVLE